MGTFHGAFFGEREFGKSISFEWHPDYIAENGVCIFGTFSGVFFWRKGESGKSIRRGEEGDK